MLARRRGVVAVGFVNVLRAGSGYRRGRLFLRTGQGAGGDHQNRCEQSGSEFVL
jgi:hypothetical protein